MIQKLQNDPIISILSKNFNMIQKFRYDQKIQIGPKSIYIETTYYCKYKTFEMIKEFDNDKKFKIIEKFQNDPRY